MKTIRIDCSQIRDRDSFHDRFAETFGFPAFYGRNMDAWIDCLTNIDDVAAGMTSIHVNPGEVLTLILDDVKALKARCPEIHEALIECSAFVNWRRLDVSQPPVLALAFAN